MKVGEQITINSRQYEAVKEVQRFSCKGCAFYRIGMPCGCSDSIVAACIISETVFKTV